MMMINTKLFNEFAGIVFVFKPNKTDFEFHLTACSLLNVELLYFMFRVS